MLCNSHIKIAGVEIRVDVDGIQIPFNKNSDADTDKRILAQLHSQEPTPHSLLNGKSIINQLLPSVDEKVTE